MFDGKTLIDYTNLFSPHDFKKNDKIIKDIIINKKILKNYIKDMKKIIKLLKILLSIKKYKKKGYNY